MNYSNFTEVLLVKCSDALNTFDPNFNNDLKNLSRQKYTLKDYL